MRLTALFAALLTASLVVAGCEPGSGRDDREQPSTQSPETAEGAESAGGAEGGAAEHTFDPDDSMELVGAPVKGSTEALVTIVEFSDFQCPFCSRVLPTLDQLIESEEFEGKVRVVFKHLPLGFHDRARPAAIASMAAHEQGMFWEYHDVLFENQRELSDENLMAYAEELGLDMDAFRAAMENEEVAARVDGDAEMAGSLGVRGTPNFLINGRSLSGAQPFDNFATIVREEIEAMEGLIEEGKTREEAYAARLEENRSANEAAEERQQPTQRQQPPQPDPDAELYVPVAESAFKGPEDALVTIVEFSEFQCPFCSRVNPTVAQIIETYGDDVRVVFKHNPLSFHDRAEPAARAAIAAQNQGKFWEYHDILFSNQQQLTDANLERWAEELGLDMDRFRADMQSEATSARIAEDQALAQRLAAGGTPHFFVNGYRLRGAQPFENFQRVIDARLEEAEALVAAGTPRAQVYTTLQEDAERGNAPMIQPAGGNNNAAAQADPEPVEIEVTDEPFLGPADAEVTMVIYSDFTCGYCNRFHDTIYEAHEGYEDRVRIVFKHFPRGSTDLAVATIAAHRQGKFWEMHDAIFEQGARTAAQAEGIAEELGLNMDQYREVVNDPATAAYASAQRAEGSRFGVRGTPTWFVNGNISVGAQGAAQVRAAWDAALNE